MTEICSSCVQPAATQCSALWGSHCGLLSQAVNQVYMEVRFEFIEPRDDPDSSFSHGHQASPSPVECKSRHSVDDS